MLRNQDQRTITVLGAILGVLVLFVCGLFVYDFSHLDQGWIQDEISKYYQSASCALSAVRAWWSSLSA